MNPAKFSMCALTSSTLLETRVSAKLTQLQVSDSLGIARSTYSDWERGKSPIPRHHYRRLEDLLYRILKHQFQLNMPKPEIRSMWRSPSGTLVEVLIVTSVPPVNEYYPIHVVYKSIYTERIMAINIGTLYDQFKMCSKKNKSRSLTQLESKLNQKNLQ